MGHELHATWGDIAHHWDDWGPPLRPSAEDIQITRRLLSSWHMAVQVPTPKAFICGVTPEFAKMGWPFPVDLLAMDQAESMVRVVWPGDIPGVRRAVVGNWLESGLSPASQDIILADGSFVFFDPNGARQLAKALASLLKPDGIFICRHYASPPEREHLSDVFAAARVGQIPNFHAFKWRVATALQSDTGASGVRQHDIWKAVQWAITEDGLDFKTLPQPGFSAEAVNTIRFYKDKEARLFFPTLENFLAVLRGSFNSIEVEYPSYEGTRYPLLVAGRPN